MTVEEQRRGLRERVEKIERESERFVREHRGKPMSEASRREAARLSSEMRELQIEVELVNGEGDEKLLDRVTGQRRQFSKPRGDMPDIRSGTPFDRRDVPAVARGRRYADMFPGERMDSGGFESFESFLKTLHSRRVDPRLTEQRGTAHWGVIDSEGGAWVPTQYASELLDAALESEIVRPRARVRPMTTDSVEVAGFNNRDHTGGSLFGGFKAVWMAESGTATRQRTESRKIKLTSKKLALYTSASNEQLADAQGFRDSLTTAMVQAVAWGLDDSFLNGDGSGKPLGVVNSPSLVSVAIETGQTLANGPLLYENLTKMVGRMHPSLVNGAVWVCNTTLKPYLLTLAFPVGTGGSIIPVMTRGPEGFEVLGSPIFFTEKLPTLGTTGDILYVNFSEYQIGLRQNVSIGVSNVPGWFEDETDFRAILRVDGQDRWNGPITPKNGDTLSWCVALDTRT